MVQKKPEATRNWQGLEPDAYWEAYFGTTEQVAEKTSVELKLTKKIPQGLKPALIFGRFCRG
jgi:hypothetical protein